jgi:hypothetical protein
MTYNSTDRPGRQPRLLCLHLIAVALAGNTLAGAWLAASTEGRPTLSIGVVVDTHPRQRAVIDFERRVIDSLKNAMADAATNIFVVGYSDHVQLLQDWSPGDVGLNAASAKIAVDEGADASRGDALNDGLMEAVTRLRASADGSLRSLIVIGEGHDGDSHARFGEVLKAARAGNVRCFALLVATHRSQVGRVRQFGFDLFRLAGGTEGRAWDVRTNPDALDKAMTSLQSRLTSARKAT